MAVGGGRAAARGVVLVLVAGGRGGFGERRGQLDREEARRRARLAHGRQAVLLAHTAPTLGAALVARDRVLELHQLPLRAHTNHRTTHQHMQIRTYLGRIVLYMYSTI